MNRSILGEHAVRRTSCSLLTLALLCAWGGAAWAQDDTFSDDLDADLADGPEDMEDVEDATPEPSVEDVEPDPPRAERGESKRLSVGARLGGSYNKLSRPDDPAGEPTLLFGSVFSGPGYAVGAQASWLATSSDYLNISIEPGLMFSMMRGIGYAQNTDMTQRQSIELETKALRIPLLIRLATREGKMRFSLLLGPEILLGLSSSATVTNEGIANEPAPLYTKPVTHVGLSTGLGVSLDLGKVKIPFDFRLTWDPMVPGSTRERFEDYRSLEDPGTYQVGFDTQLLFLLGVDYAL